MNHRNLTDYTNKALFVMGLVFIIASTVKLFDLVGNYSNRDEYILQEFFLFLSLGIFLLLPLIIKNMLKKNEHNLCAISFFKPFSSRVRQFQDTVLCM